MSEGKKLDSTTYIVLLKQLYVNMIEGNFDEVGKLQAQYSDNEPPKYELEDMKTAVSGVLEEIKKLDEPGDSVKNLEKLIAKLDEYAGQSPVNYQEAFEDITIELLNASDEVSASLPNHDALQASMLVLATVSVDMAKQNDVIMDLAFENVEAERNVEAVKEKTKLVKPPASAPAEDHHRYMAQMVEQKATELFEKFEEEKYVEMDAKSYNELLEKAQEVMKDPTIENLHQLNMQLNDFIEDTKISATVDFDTHPDFDWMRESGDLYVVTIVDDNQKVFDEEVLKIKEDFVDYAKDNDVDIPQPETIDKEALNQEYGYVLPADYKP